jgi:hypothetical protein
MQSQTGKRYTADDGNPLNHLFARIRHESLHGADREDRIVLASNEAYEILLRLLLDRKPRSPFRYTKADFMVVADVQPQRPPTVTMNGVSQKNGRRISDSDYEAFGGGDDSCFGSRPIPKREANLRSLVATLKAHGNAPLAVEHL